MSLSDDLNVEVKKIFDDKWQTRDGQKVPEPENIGLGNEAVVLDRATVLYADISGSTDLVDGYKWWFAAEAYKTFLHCAAKIIKDQGGKITAYDGDRIMGIFIGSHQTTNAASCALKINYAVTKIINPAMKKRYPKTSYELKHTVGIDTSEIHATRTGVRGDNDIVWVGRAANYAAKLTELKLSETSWMTKEAYDWANESAKKGGDPKQNMWKKYNWSQHNDVEIYGSTWWRKV